MFFRVDMHVPSVFIEGTYNWPESLSKAVALATDLLKVASGKKKLEQITIRTSSAGWKYFDTGHCEYGELLRAMRETTRIMATIAQYSPAAIKLEIALSREGEESAFYVLEVILELGIEEVLMINGSFRNPSVSREE